MLTYADACCRYEIARYQGQVPYQKAVDVIVKALLDAQTGVKSILIKILVSRAGSHKKTPTGAYTILGDC